MEFVAMNVKQLRESGQIIFEAVVGSHAYGTATEKSDMDIRGVFMLPVRERLTILQQPTEVGEASPEDVKYYELKKFFTLAADCNPNIIELLFMPENCIRYISRPWNGVVENRDIFMSKKAYHTFSGYAYAQIKKAKGENKWINNPKPKTPPQRSDFCWVIPSGTDLDMMPGRPIPISSAIRSYGDPVDLSEYHVAKLEHVSDTYRLYHYGREAKGVFRDGNIACESIPLEDEQLRFEGFLVYNDQEYQKAMLDWKNYWQWIETRNPERWKSQERGDTDFDCKNMQHCLRLLMSGENILKSGEPIVAFEGEKLQYLKDIRAGKYSYDKIMADVEARMETLKQLYETSSLPHSADMKAIDNMFRELC